MNCILTNLFPPTPTVALSAETEPASDTSPNVVSRFNEAAGETTANGGAFTSPGAAAASAISTWASIAVASMGTSTPASSKSTTAARGQTASQFSGSAATTEQKLSKDASASQPAIAAASPLGPQATLTLTQPTGSQPQGAQADSDPVRATSPWSMQDSGGVQAAPASTGFTDSSPRLETFDCCANTCCFGTERGEKRFLHAGRCHRRSSVGRIFDPTGKAWGSRFAGRVQSQSVLSSTWTIRTFERFTGGGFYRMGSGPTSSTEQVGQEAATVRLGMIEVAPQALATGREDMAELSDSLGNFAGSAN